MQEKRGVGCVEFYSRSAYAGAKGRDRGHVQRENREFVMQDAESS